MNIFQGPLDKHFWIFKDHITKISDFFPKKKNQGPMDQNLWI